MLFTGTVWFVCGAWYSELELLELPSDIGQFSSTNILYTQLGLIKKIFYTINIFLADSLLTYRLFIVWGRSIPLVMVPAMVWLGVVAAGIATVVLTSRPQASFDASYVINIEIAFFCMSVSLNVLCTVLIAWRLLLHRHDVRHLGFTSSKKYTSVLIGVSESAALYSVVGIVCIPLEVLQTPVQFPFNSLVGTLTV
ncbi:hypothetical protein GSI_14613 [Ganoderma sinense ZZ0214-1]|uniref:Uncharacterized protein n=1 Tax=Ganoderma sinense ZZ0214-1 TaxID=1077348 RepID=A0A2G8RP83_9APHY|nr:hypothetical protein GSI_14613 [Ganoderma sinense ZZ0214-1]